MPVFTLNAKEKRALEELVRRAPLTNAGRRAQALVWLDEGEGTQGVAFRLHVSRQTVYNWITGFHERRSERNIQARLADRKRSGRPPSPTRVVTSPLPETLDPLIAVVIGRDPRECGYRSIIWTVKLLRQYLRDAHRIAVPQKSVSASLERLEMSQEPGQALGGEFSRTVVAG